MTASYEKLLVKNIRYLSKQVVLYNLSVDEHHNFYVSHDDVLAHNIIVGAMVPIVAWGAGGLAFGPAAPAVWAIGAVATIIGGIAISEIAKHSNSPVNDDIYMQSRGKNHFKPDTKAEGDHTTFRPEHYET